MIDESINLSNEIESLTKSLVQIKSVNNTTGERDVAEFLLGWLRALDRKSVV